MSCTVGVGGVGGEARGQGRWGGGRSPAGGEELLGYAEYVTLLVEPVKIYCCRHDYLPTGYFVVSCCSHLGEKLPGYAKFEIKTSG